MLLFKMRANCFATSTERFEQQDGKKDSNKFFLNFFYQKFFQNFLEQQSGEVSPKSIFAELILEVKIAQKILTRNF